MFWIKNSSSHRAYTLSEGLVVLAIIGVISMVLIPIFRQIIPSKEEQMHKKVSYLIEQIVADMYEDENLYPKTSDIDIQGFRNTQKVTLKGKAYEGKTKFCELFASKFNKIKTAASCGETNDENQANRAKPAFRSVDYIDWWVPQTNFENGYAKITVDVNGSDQGKNCVYGTNNCKDKHADKFEYYVKYDGTVTLADPTEYNSSSYKIAVNVKTLDQDGVDISNSVSNNGCSINLGTYSGGSYTYNDSSKQSSGVTITFDNLQRNTRYQLKAEPLDGYYSNWKDNIKNVRTASASTKVQLICRKKTTYTLTLNVLGCNEDTVADCFKNAQLKTCKFESVSDSSGEYNRDSNSLDKYEYVGSGGEYTYQCDNDNIKSFTPNGQNEYKISNLDPGDYQIYLKTRDDPEDIYYVFNGDKTEYKQNLRLGSSDLTMNIKIYNKL